MLVGVGDVVKPHLQVIAILFPDGVLVLHDTRPKKKQKQQIIGASVEATTIQLGSGLDATSNAHGSWPSLTPASTVHSPMTTAHLSLSALRLMTMSS